jgi:sucrose-6-phosphate hydrolase SacC (GH32 family)
MPAKHTFPVILLCLSLGGPTIADEPVISSFAESTEAPHGLGNLYAPDILKHRGELLMFFGGQGKDGHDRIHLATSKDGGTWKQEGIVFAPKGVNHVNDPSVVAVDGMLYMFYTLAGSGITDSIGLATSADGRKWSDRGAVFAPSPSPAWDSLLVGRPSVIHDGEQFHLWYDGRKDLPPGAPDPDAPKSDTSRRFVGYATSADGMKWDQRGKPVFGEDAGGIHVFRSADGFAMVIESRDGTWWATSPDGVTWKPQGLLHPKDDDSPHGHVTPFVIAGKESWQLFYGAAQAEAWNQNSIYSAELEPPAIPKTTKR